MRIFVHLLAKICAHLCAFLKNFDVRIFVRLLAKVCAHLSSELLVTLEPAKSQPTRQKLVVVSFFPWRDSSSRKIINTKKECKNFVKKTQTEVISFCETVKFLRQK